MASTITYPKSLPQLDTVSYEVPDTRLRSAPDVGPVSMRNRTTSARDTVTGRLVFKAHQCTEFLAFYKTTLKGGTLTFNWEHPIDDTPVEMSFVSISDFKPERSGHATNRLWSLQVKLEIHGAA